MTITKRAKPKFERPAPPKSGALILGVDASSSGTGLALLRSPGGYRDVLALTLLTPPTKLDYQRRIDWTCDALERQTRDFAHPEVIAIELTDGAKWMGRSRAKGWTYSVIPLAGAQFAIRQTLRRIFPTARIETYSSSQWGRGKPKPDRAKHLAAVYPEYQKLAAKDRGYDAADALGIAVWRIGY